MNNTNEFINWTCEFSTNNPLFVNNNLKSGLLIILYDVYYYKAIN